jgi:hypothetical protein
MGITAGLENMQELKELMLLKERVQEVIFLILNCRPSHLSLLLARDAQ